MARVFTIVLFLLGCLPLAVSPARAVDAGRFQVLHMKQPTLDVGVEPPGLAFVISDITGWNQQAEDAATALQRDGWLAVGLDLAKYRASLQHGADTCHDVGDELIGLSQQIQREQKFPTYLTPVLVGFGQGGVLSYAAIRQALPASFTAGVAIGATDTLALPKSLCDGPPAKKRRGGAWQYDLTRPLLVPFADLPAAAGLPASLRHYQRNPSSDSIADLPLVAMPLSGPVAGSGDSFVIFISGDGGWRDLDKTIAEELYKQGIAVVGWDSLRYFWSRKTPEQLASDLGRVMKHYGQLWHKTRVALIGYSFGADAIPFAYNRLPAELQGHVGMLGLLGLGKAASFEIEVEGYIGLDGDSDLPLQPELARLPGNKILCMYGKDDAGDSSCPSLKAQPQALVIETPGGHHFDEDYGSVARQLHGAIK